MTVALRLPVVERVNRQFTHGVFPLRFETAWVATPVNLNVKEQSGVCAAYAIGGRIGLWWLVKVHTATRARRVKGRTFRSVVMPHIVDLFRMGWKCSRAGGRT